MELQRRNGVALWRQIQDWLEFRIKEGEMPPGSKLPTEQELAERFGVNRHTVRRALTLLSEKELIRTEQGSGSFVREQIIDYAVGARTRFHENLLRQERKPRGELVSSGVIPATTEVARALELEKGVARHRARNPRRSRRGAHLPGHVPHFSPGPLSGPG